MSKRETIDRIRRLNPTAQAEFLARFPEGELIAYLHQLQELERDRRVATLSRELEPALA